MRVELAGFEPAASSMRPRRSSQLSYTHEGGHTLPGSTAAAEPAGPSSGGGFVSLDGPLEAGLEHGGGDVAAGALGDGAE